MTTNTTRRSLLRLGTGALAYGAGAAVVAGGIAIAGEAKGATFNPHRAAWDRTMAAYLAAKDKFTATDRMHDQAYAAWTADLPKLDGIDMEEFWPMTKAQILRLEPDTYERERFESGTWFPTEKEAARFRAAVEGLRDHHRQCRANDERHGIDAIGERHDAECNAMCDLESELMGLPAPDLQAVAWKLSIILAPGDDGHTGSYSVDYVQPVLADVRRLSSGEA